MPLSVVLNDEGKLVQFVSVGMTAEQMALIPHPPRGKGLVGELMNREEPLRVPVIQDHPRSVGFPVNQALGLRYRHSQYCKFT